MKNFDMTPEMKLELLRTCQNRTSSFKVWHTIIMEIFCILIHNKLTVINVVIFIFITSLFIHFILHMKMFNDFSVTIMYNTCIYAIMNVMYVSKNLTILMAFVLFILMVKYIIFTETRVDIVIEIIESKMKDEE